MSQTSTGSEVSPNVVLLTPKELVCFYPSGLPTDLCDSTTDGENELFYGLSSVENREFSDFEVMTVTGWQDISLLLSQPYDFLALREQSGLTWDQLAILFNVTPRIIHYWRNGQRKMPAEYVNTLNQFVRLLCILDLGPAYRARQFLERTLLMDHDLLNLFIRRDFISLEKWARLSVSEPKHTELPISTDSFYARLPERVSEVLSRKGQSRTQVKLSKARAVKVARRRG